MNQRRHKYIELNFLVNMMIKNNKCQQNNNSKETVLAELSTFQYVKKLKTVKHDESGRTQINQGIH